MFLKLTKDLRDNTLFVFFRNIQMGIVHNPHDNFFKTSLSNLKVARSFFETHLPISIRQYLDFNTLELQPGNYIDKV